ncbi:hypothetical protein SUGI_0120960 [Cryptomeria japonica]|uniref:glycerophosphodiester phosphodiesterase GDPDL3 isoform X2 n=1 Tax=Cryptomeria japonica TaxID=3369 RepID=UPI002408B553|nr:glycerophosphodiester phosphodiesterase GDPDL3 isoform X2 [Cryptomeria japonica]GLJ10050.1 hypothetical protein SUGI_0120960 [Cryptomeria japonica]
MRLHHTGEAPLVIARGGLSGLFPDYVKIAYEFAINNSLYEAVMFCDLQLTKDGQGICRTNLDLENSTNIQLAYPNRNSTYLVNGKNISGYFSIDFTADELFNNVSAIQSYPTRTHSLDQINAPFSPEEFSGVGQSSIWLNVQYSNFFDEHKLSMASYMESLSKRMTLNYISSTEVGFLRAIAPKYRSKTKLILRFMNKEDIDPSINETYGSMLRDLTSLKEFASGILVPKSYIWPLDPQRYLQAPTDLVKDAHAVGLEIFASDFNNDGYDMSYNYSYDPIREYLQFVDNKNFAVDGFLTDFSVTASEAIACYAHNNASRSPEAGNPLIISHNGASGDYPGCTDVAYQAAIRDGVDYIDCSVQITRDGIAFCRESPDLFVGTTIASNSAFYPSRMKTIPTIKNDQGIFTFDLTWKEIQSLTVNIYNKYEKDYQLYRNPAAANVGKYMNLTAFLEFAIQVNISVLISIENARAIISERNLDVTNATLSALNQTGYNKISDRIMIQSDDSAVLLQFKQRTNFKLIYKVLEADVTVSSSAIEEIRKFANTVALPRSSLFRLANNYFLLAAPDVVKRFHNHNISVFVYTLRNEFPSLAFDFLADPTMEINSFVQVAKVDGLVTDFPATAKAYLGNKCLHPRTEDDYLMFLVDPGVDLSNLQPENFGPAIAPEPSLSSVTNSPLPSLKEALAPGPDSKSPSTSPDPRKNSSNRCSGRSLFVSLMIAVLLFLNSH